MNIFTKKDDTCLIVKLIGEFDMHSVPDFRKTIVKEMESNNLINLVLDFNKVNFIDSSGLGAVLGRYRELDKKDGLIVLVGLKPQVRKIFKLSGMLKIINSYDSIHSAINDLKMGGSDYV